jgi:hypothetical protein
MTDAAFCVKSTHNLFLFSYEGNKTVCGDFGRSTLSAPDFAAQGFGT